MIALEEDLAGAICTDADRVWRRATVRMRDKLLACMAVNLVEAARSSREPQCWNVARSIVTSGHQVSSLRGIRGPTDQVATANAYLTHALLRDDAYGTALHPGQLVIPVALALSEEADVAGAITLEAVAIGYEVTCRLADLLLPEVSNRGWRVTALLSPIAAAATAASILRPGDHAALAAAVRLGATVMGGPLHTVAAGEDWRAQPSLLVSAGMACARMAASGYQANSGHIEAAYGALDQFTGSRVAKELDHGSRLESVTFKSHSGPMFCQALLRAIDSIAGTLLSAPCSVTVALSPFAVSYAGASADAGSVANIEHIVFDRLSIHASDAELAGVDITVIADDSVHDLDAVVEVSTVARASTREYYSGDTSTWSFGDVRREATSEMSEASDLVDAVAELEGALNVRSLIDSWQRLAEAEPLRPH